MFSTKHAEYLISLPKTLVDTGSVVDLTLKRNRIELISPDDNDHKFLLELTSNEKIVLKTSIHHQENTSYIGLLRIDYKGTHINPDYELQSLPEQLKPYIDKHFSPDEPHVHVYVEGYRPLAWALPLSDYDFSIQNLKEKQDVVDLLLKFADTINIISNIHIKSSLF